MSVNHISQSGTGTMLWTGTAANEIQAMDAMAHDAATTTTPISRKTCVADLRSKRCRSVRPADWHLLEERGAAGPGQFVRSAAINNRNLGRPAG